MKFSGVLYVWFVCRKIGWAWNILEHWSAHLWTCVVKVISALGLTFTVTLFINPHDPTNPIPFINIIINASPSIKTYFLWLSVIVIPFSATLKCTTIAFGLLGINSSLSMASRTALGPVSDSISKDWRYRTLQAENRKEQI